jgi:hypothetical protein
MQIQIQKHISHLINNSNFVELYNNFLLKKDYKLFNQIIDILQNELKYCDNKIFFYLLDHDENIIYFNNSSNSYVKYISNSNKYFVNKLYSMFLYKENKENKSNIDLFEINDNNYVGFIVNYPVKCVCIINANSNPWVNQINGYYYWQGNFVGSSPATQYYFNSVSGQQINYQQPSNLVPTSSQFNYYGDNLPPNLNMIVLFTGYSKVSDILSGLKNYTTGTNMYTNAKNYFQSNQVQNYLISLCFGGGVASTGGWDTGNSGAIYSIYQACTKKGVYFSYEETGNGNVLSGYGDGTLDYSYNSFTFDIETWGYYSNTGSTGKDFINLFNYIKTNPNSNLYSWEMIIIVTIAHSCSNYNGTGQNVISELLADSTGSYDFISPQLYTQNVGTTVEYCANYNILWSDTGSNDNFVYYLSQNKNFIKYGLGMILPSLFYNGLLNTGGSNDSNPPNLYFYQSSSNNSNPPIGTASGWKQINYQTDKGAGLFFNSIFYQSNVNLGGCVQWVNGDL